MSHIIRGEDKESGVSEQGREQDRILNQYEYDAFGNTISCEERVANRFRYQGEQYDPVTRQYYLRARYYNPVIGRFIQEDTYYGDGLNLYEYCRNNTITYKDPTGHNICPTQRDLYHKYKEEGMSPQEAYQKMRKELGLDSKSGYKDSGVGNGKDPWRSYESGSSADLGNKLDYQFGKAGGNRHNIDRTNGLKAEMDKLGFNDTAENRAYFEQYYNDVLNSSNNIVGVPETASYIENGVTHYYTVTTRESFLMGKYGGAKVTTYWDGNRLLTIKIGSGKQTRYNH